MKAQWQKYKTDSFSQWDDKENKLVDGERDLYNGNGNDLLPETICNLSQQYKIRHGLLLFCFRHFIINMSIKQFYKILVRKNSFYSIYLPTDILNDRKSFRQLSTSTIVTSFYWSFITNARGLNMYVRGSRIASEGPALCYYGSE